GLREAYIWPVNAERQSTPQQIARTIRTVRRSKVPGVFCESTQSPEGMEQVAREGGSRLAGTLYVDSLTGPDGPVPTYLDL
ncbi:zinc ABC transporter substrate-binding protein, partial [Escherichia coli]|nr:zinc ABC transporter substrate-binding protein [Escherichia coli]